MSSNTIESNLQERGLFQPPATFSRTSHVKSIKEYQRLGDRARENPERFWAELAANELQWFKTWDKVLDWQPPFAKWFVGGKLNITHNCLDRHLTANTKNMPALVWQGEPGDCRTYTYAQLHQEVCQMANVLKRLGVTKGDRVGIYLPMIPEAAIAMLACARIGAVHSVIFAGFSAEAVKGRLLDASAKVVITADGGWRKNKIVPLKQEVDKALAHGEVPSVESILVVIRTGQKVHMQPDRDYWWQDLQNGTSTDCPAEPMDSEDTLFILYTSGTTGKPKGVVHTVGGYSLYTHVTTKWAFDLKDTDVFWCTADVGWITGHSYAIYGPLSNGATTVMYEGAPHADNPGCLWDVVEKYGVTIFYTAPTVIRLLMTFGDELPQSRNLSSLRLLGTVGEPINPAVWLWYHRVIGRGNCPIVDTWWQTETGGVMLTPLPGAIPTKPGSATLPFPGIVADVVDLEGNPVPTGQGGYLVITQPWPGMIRTVYNNPDRYLSTYWTKIAPKDGQYFYFTGDGARQDEDGYFWIIGRVDDVINIAGHRLGTMEVESALVAHSAVAEAAVVGRASEIKGEELVAFVTLKPDYIATEELTQGLKQHVVHEIGAIARPAEIKFAQALPKTRSGKIMRRFLRAIASGEEVTGDVSTLEDRTALDKLRS